MSKVFAGYHIVFSTKHRLPTLSTDEMQRALYGYIFGILKKRNCYTYRIGGVKDHVHLALDLNPSIALSDLVRDIKRAATNFLSPENGYYNFQGWSNGYYASTFSFDQRENVIEYIKTQYDHHCGKTLAAELEWMALKAGLAYHPDDLL